MGAKGLEKNHGSFIQFVRKRHGVPSVSRKTDSAAAPGGAAGLWGSALGCPRSHGLFCRRHWTGLVGLESRAQQTHAPPKTQAYRCRGLRSVDERPGRGGEGAGQRVWWLVARGGQQTTRTPGNPPLRRAGWGGSIGGPAVVLEGPCVGGGWAGPVGVALVLHKPRLPMTTTDDPAARLLLLVHASAQNAAVVRLSNDRGRLAALGTSLASLDEETWSQMAERLWACLRRGPWVRRPPHVGLHLDSQATADAPSHFERLPLAQAFSQLWGLVDQAGALGGVRVRVRVRVDTAATGTRHPLFTHALDALQRRGLLAPRTAYVTLDVNPARRATRFCLESLERLQPARLALDALDEKHRPGVIQDTLARLASWLWAQRQPPALEINTADRLPENSGPMRALLAQAPSCPVHVHTTLSRLDQSLEVLSARKPGQTTSAHCSTATLLVYAQADWRLPAQLDSQAALAHLDTHAALRTFVFDPPATATPADVGPLSGALLKLLSWRPVRIIVPQPGHRADPGWHDSARALRRALDQARWDGTCLGHSDYRLRHIDVCYKPERHRGPALVLHAVWAPAFDLSSMWDAALPPVDCGPRRSASGPRADSGSC